MNRITIEIDAAHIVAAFGRFAAVSTADLLQRLGATVKGQTLSRFNTETDPDGNAWAPLAPNTIVQKGSSGILEDSGTLMGSIMVQASGNEAVVGTNVEYASFNQEGTRKMPARPFMGIGGDDFDQIKTVIDTWAASNFR